MRGTRAELTGPRQTKVLNQELPDGELASSRAEECRRLALDLHNSTAQSLAALAMNLDIVERSGAVIDQRARRLVEESVSIARDCFREVRTLADLLYPPLVDEIRPPLTFQSHISSLTQGTGLSVDMQCDDRVTMPEKIRMTLFQFVEACFREVWCHTPCRAISVNLMQTSGAIELTIRSREPGRRQPPGHKARIRMPPTVERGMEEMRCAVLHVGGTLDVKGSTLRVRVPLEEDQLAKA
jgi:two-component system NarL family sensor kinase